jgi:hypothetical protein
VYGLFVYMSVLYENTESCSTRHHRLIQIYKRKTKSVNSSLQVKDVHRLFFVKSPRHRAFCYFYPEEMIL